MGEKSKDGSPNNYPSKGNGMSSLPTWQTEEKENNKNRHSGSLTPADYPRLREQWFKKFSDLFGEVPLELPPFREVNHEINLVDDHKRINYHLPKCPNQFKGALMEKIQRYTTAGWWVPATAKQAIPMLSIPKKNRMLRILSVLQRICVVESSGVE
jgi:hypothetical protein